MGKHGGEISIEEKAVCLEKPSRRLNHQLPYVMLLLSHGNANLTPQNPGFRNPQGGSMASKASAVWTGSLKEGKGTISTATGVLKDANYSFATRFEGAATGTTP